MKIVLASKSARRKELLSMLCSDFTIRVSDADESYSESDLFKVPALLASKKAMAVFINDDEIIIGCDTVVINDGELLGKPKDRDDAVRMLKAMSGHFHYVVSGVFLRTREKCHSFSVSTRVYMRELTDGEIDFYVDRFEPYDKAGAYGIQESAGAFIEKIDGDFYNVVGLPICALTTALRDEFGIVLLKEAL